MRIAFGLLLLVTAIGCTNRADTEPVSAVSESDSSSTNSSPTSSFEPAKSPEELIESYRLAFLNGDVDAITEMVYWGDFHGNWELLTPLLATGTAKHGSNKTIGVKLEDVPEGYYLPGEELTLEPIKMMQGGFGDEDEDGDGGGGSIEAPIGEVDGVYYFGVFKESIEHWAKKGLITPKPAS